MHERHEHLDLITWLEELSDRIKGEFRTHAPTDLGVSGSPGALLARAKKHILEELAEVTMCLQLNEISESCGGDYQPDVVLGLQEEPLGFLANPQPVLNKWAKNDCEVSYDLMRRVHGTWTPEPSVHMGVTLRRVWRRTQIPVAYLLRIAEHRLTTALALQGDVRLKLLIGQLRTLSSEISQVIHGETYCG